MATMGEAAFAIGKTRRTLERWRRQPGAETWWDAEQRSVDLDALLAWQAAQGSAEPPPATSPPVVATVSSRELPADLVAGLGSADPLAQVKAASQVAGLEVVSALRDGRASGPALHALKAQLDEFRKAESSWLELGVRKGDLMPRSEAVEAVGEVARRGVQAVESLKAALAVQVECWLADPAFLALGADARRVAVRAWATATTRAVRQETADSFAAGAALAAP